MRSINHGRHSHAFMIGRQEMQKNQGTNAGRGRDAVVGPGSLGGGADVGEARGHGTLCLGLLRRACKHLAPIQGALGAQRGDLPAQAGPLRLHPLHNRLVQIHLQDIY